MPTSKRVVKYTRALTCHFFSSGYVHCSFRQPSTNFYRKITRRNINDRSTRKRNTEIACETRALSLTKPKALSGSSIVNQRNEFFGISVFCSRACVCAERFDGFRIAKGIPRRLQFQDFEHPALRSTIICDTAQNAKRSPSIFDRSGVHVSRWTATALARNSVPTRHEQPITDDYSKFRVPGSHKRCI